jgi:hypothetical protein
MNQPSTVEPQDLFSLMTHLYAGGKNTRMSRES